VARVMAVDDEQAIRGLLAVNLELEGHEVITAANGRDALEQLERVRPDLILLDVMMPNVSGWQVAESLRASPATRAIPIVFLTAKVSDADVDRGGELGVDAYVTKPFDPLELMDLVNRILAVQGPR
jgi:CheY-like chemotaxis protein